MPAGMFFSGTIAIVPVGATLAGNAWKAVTFDRTGGIVAQPESKRDTPAANANVVFIEGINYLPARFPSILVLPRARYWSDFLPAIKRFRQW